MASFGESPQACANRSKLAAVAESSSKVVVALTSSKIIHFSAVGQPSSKESALFSVGQNCCFGKGNDFQMRIGAEIVGEAMEDRNEGFVGLTVVEIFPPVRHEDCELLALNVRFDGVEHGFAGPMIGKEAAGMTEKERAVDAPMRALEGFDESISWPPGIGQAPQFKPTGGDDPKLGGDERVTRGREFIVRG